MEKFYRLLVLSWLLVGIVCEEVDVHRYDVIIVGAGVAGIAAASKLFQNEYSNILILEARNRVGGRVHTVKIDGKLVEFGAEAINCNKDNELYDLIKNSGLTYPNPVNWREIDPVAPINKRLSRRVVQDLLKLKNRFTHIRSVNGSFGRFMLPKYINMLQSDVEISNSDYEAYMDVVIKELSIRYGGDMFDTGMQSILKSETCTGISHRWKNGYRTLIKVLMGKYPGVVSGVSESMFQNKLKLNKEVTQVHWGDHGVRIVCQDGSKYQANKVLLTLPLGVLKELPGTFFQPSLPVSTQLAIELLGFGVVDKMFLTYDENWWKTYKKGFSVGMGSDAKSKFMILSSVGTWPVGLYSFEPVVGKNQTLMSWLQGDNARAMEVSHEDAVATGITELVSFLLGKEDIPPPSKIGRTFWALDAFAKGSYSFRTVESDDRNITADQLGAPLLNSRNEPVVLFAGEATDSKSYGTVHGALRSGWREAERILKESKL